MRMPLVNVHDPTACVGRPCCIHNPSDHTLRDAPLHWRPDKHVMERICPHGVGHDDPDDHAYRLTLDPRATRIHGCDGCCTRKEHR